MSAPAVAPDPSVAFDRDLDGWVAKASASSLVNGLRPACAPERLAAALDRWLTRCEERSALPRVHSESLSARTLAAYRYAAAKLVPNLGAVALIGLTELDIVEALEQLPPGSRHAVGTAWQAAMSWLGADVMPPRRAYALKPSPVDWCEDDFPAAWTALKDAHDRVLQLRRPAHVQRCTLLIAATGIRLGEGVSLHRSDIDRHGWVTVRGKSGERRLPLGPAATRVLRECPERGYLFPSARRDGRQPHVAESSVSHAVRRACDRHGLRHVKTHTLRHSLASHLAMARHPMVTIAKLLGHTSVETTARYYAHASRRSQEQAMAEAAEALTRGQLSLF